MSSNETDKDERPADEPEAVLSEGPEEEAPTSASDAELEALREKAEERDRFLDELRRARADFDNFQKRVRRERPQLEAAGARLVLLDLLEVVDNFERALDSLGRGGDAASLQAGVEMIHSQLRQVLDKQGVEEITAQGAAFDPEYHEAVAQLEVDDRPTGEVVNVLKKGYRHGDWILRPASVQVAFNAAERAAAAGVETSESESEAAESDEVSEEA